jgi:nicotinamide-nucleotide amidase
MTLGVATTAVTVSCVQRLLAREETVATAESLTAGLICASLATVPGASGALRGGVAAYATQAKATVLRVPEEVLATFGAVSKECAEAMAEAARRLFDSSWGISATGVAGPDQQEGHQVGTVFMALSGVTDTRVVRLALSGERNKIRHDSAEAALQLLLTVLSADGEDGLEGDGTGEETPPAGGVGG